uniref:Uncharacterized protein n=1 Tax=Octopus bimaculoides TaxID=37653 RepID=A0A0L8G3A9_OCTBM
MKFLLPPTKALHCFLFFCGKYAATLIKVDIGFELEEKFRKYIHILEHSEVCGFKFPHSQNSYSAEISCNDKVASKVLNNYSNYYKRMMLL